MENATPCFIILEVITNAKQQQVKPDYSLSSLLISRSGVRIPGASPKKPEIIIKFMFPGFSSFRRIKL